MMSDCRVYAVLVDMINPLSAELLVHQPVHTALRKASECTHMRIIQFKEVIVILICTYII